MSSAHNLAVNDIEQPCMKPNVRFDNADSALVYDTVCNYHWEIFQDKQDLSITIWQPPQDTNGDQ